MAAERGYWSVVGRADRALRFLAFLVIATILAPIASYQAGRQGALSQFTSALVSGVTLAVGVRLVRWWLQLSSRPR